MNTFLLAAILARPILVPSPDLPPAVAAVAEDGILALAVSADGSTAAAAYSDGIRTNAAIRRVETRGEAIALALSSEGRTLYVLERRRPKRGPPSAALVRWDLRSGKRGVEIVVPAEASSIAVDPATGSVILAAPGEIRTFEGERLASGSLYQFPGSHRAAAAVPGSSLLLVGDDDAMVVVDRAMAHTRDGLPVLARASVAAPVAAIAVSPDGARALVRLAGGAVVLATLNPLTLEDHGSANAIAWLGETERSVEASSPEPIPVPPVVSVPEAAPVPVPAPAPATPGSLSGRLAGVAAFRIVAVVALGPDNLLREAARAAPDAAGRWRIEGLVPGTYRIVLDAGGGRVASSDPPFRTATIGAGAPAVSLDFDVRAVL